MSDTCALAGHPEVVRLNSIAGAASAAVTNALSTDFCHNVTPFLTQLKLLGAYTLPQEVRLSATWQSYPPR